VGILMEDIILATAKRLVGLTSLKDVRTAGFYT
jgi:hypothetical protein